MSRFLWAAALYHVIWGAWAVLAPGAFFEWAGLAQPRYPEQWQFIGLIIVVLGIGFAAASSNPAVHWPIVLVGLLIKILSATGLFYGALHGRLPWGVGMTMAANDLIWWGPFCWILYEAHQSKLCRERSVSPEIQRMAMKARTQFGPSIAELSQVSPVLLVFLRHAGCTFCREALNDLAAQRKTIEGSDTQLVLVHMGCEEQAQPFFSKYGLEDVPRVSDPDRTVYRAFGLGRGSILKLFGPKVWIRGFESAVLHRNGAGRLVGDGFQMPGVFLIFHGTVLKSYRHQSAADRPDYPALTSMDSFPEWEHQ